MKKKALYIGGFCMPDGNAAAQRVLGVAKLLNECDVDVRFCGLKRNINEPETGEIDGFPFINHPYPSSALNWLEYLIGHDHSIAEIESYEPDYVILYNHPALAIDHISNYCHKHSIKVIADVTEWYVPQGNPIFKLIKGYDTTRRMTKSHKKLDGLICISNYLEDYYKISGVPVLNIPPLVDVTQPKWHQHTEAEKGKINLVYAGSPGSAKDRLDLIVDSLDKSGDTSRIIFDVIGISAEQFKQTWNIDKEYPFVKFHGRLPHTEVIKYLLNADFQIFLRPDTLANRAGFPTKFVETITAGTLPITNLSSNLSDYLRDGENGVVIESLDPDSIKYALNKALSFSTDEIQRKKNSLNTKTFDFRNYIQDCKKFISII